MTTTNERIASFRKAKQLEVLKIGKALLSAGIKATAVHPEVLGSMMNKTNAATVGKLKARPAAAWFGLFVAFMCADGATVWPMKQNPKTQQDSDEPVGYRTIMRKPLEYSKDLLYAAEYYNRLQSFLASHKLIQPVSPVKGGKSGQAVIITADDMKKRLDAILALVPQDKRDEALPALQQFARIGFGIAGYTPDNPQK